ncbi:MAG TPA: ATP-dependent zinc metalloprotease FtsH [Firmicutes bacterium]|nr:MAG: cell division protein FtsH [Peptococcaceae bacterium 1109]HHT73374.1 ATP-dependent zinc metalloprotease FtsH [Bacillota bacterium]
MEEKPNPRRPLIVYYIGSLLLIMLFNAIVYPMLIRSRINEVDYSTFLQLVEEGRVREVQLDSVNQQIAFTAIDRAGSEQVYVTGAVPDPDLVNRLLASKSPVRFSGVMPRPHSPLLSFLTNWIVPILIFVGLGQFFSKQMQSRMRNAMAFGKSNARVYVKAQTGKTFADVAGQDEAKEALQEIVDFLHDPERYAEIGATLPKGALLVGPPGTGKTLLAQAVAGEANVPFFSISGSEFVEMFVGLGAAKVRDLFKQATEKAPCIVFIDEIDTIGKKRGDGGFTGNDEREQTLNQLLTEMDGFDSRKGVVLLAATNRPDALDPALLRPGRFDRRIPVELPDLAGRISILEVHAKKVRMAEPIDFAAIARATAGASGADLANIINEAALRAVRMGRKAVQQIDLEESVEVVIAGYQRKNAALSPKERQMVAYHELGHAIVAAKQGHSAPVHKITIVPRTSGALGYTLQIEEADRHLISKEEAFARLVTLTGGRAAEELIFNTVTTGAANDIEQATGIARAMVTRYGMSDRFGMMALETQTNPYLNGNNVLTCSSETAAQVDLEVMKLISKAHETAIAILKDNMEKLHEIATYLLEKETISGEEFLQLLNA